MRSRRDILERFVAIDLQSSRAVTAPNRTLTLALLILAVFALLVRCVAIAEPLGIDQSLWASAVRGMSRGQLLYQNVWEQRPPGIYLLYLAGFLAFGWTAATVAWLDVLAAVALTALLFVLGRALADRATGALAAALFAALTIPAGLWSHGGFLERSVCETFIPVAVALAAWCAVRFQRRPADLAAFGVGLFSGAAIVLKPNAGLYLPALLLWMILYSPERSDRRWVAFARPVAAASLGAALIPILTILWLWGIGVLGEARAAVIDFNRYYVAQGFDVGTYAIDFSKAVWLRIKTNALWLAGAAGAVFALVQLLPSTLARGTALGSLGPWRTRSLPPLAGLAVCWGGAATVVIIVNGARLFNSYFIQAHAPLALLAAWYLVEVFRGSRVRRAVGAATVTLMAAASINGGYVSKVMTWGRADLDALRGREEHDSYLERFGSYANRRGYSARANAELAAYVREHTSPDDRVFLFGINGAGVYFAADRLTAQRFLRVNFFVATDFPDPRFRLEAVLAELAAARPRYLIFERLHTASEMAREVDSLPGDPAVENLLQAYNLEMQIEDFTLYRRRD